MLGFIEIQNGMIVYSGSAITGSIPASQCFQLKEHDHEEAYLLIFIVLFASLLASCASSSSAPTTAIEMIEPGDRVGDFLITTGELGDVTFHWELDSTKGEEANTAFVDVTWGTKLIPTVGIYDDTFGGKLDENWANFTEELYIESRPVNLPAFGTIDVKHPMVGTMRHYNLVIVANQPGKITLNEKTELQGEIGEWTTTYTFLPPDPESTNYLRLKTSEQAKLSYLLYLPEAYGKDPQQKWPLILYLHGLYSQGTDLSLIEREPLPKQLKTQADFSAIVVSPQGSGEYEFWSEDDMVDKVMTLLDEIQAAYAVDSQRIYLTGPNIGGNGVWDISLRYPERFAALVPVVGWWGYPMKTPDNICNLIEVPVWAFHGANDTKIPLSVQQELVDALTACGGNAKLTIIPNYGHDIEIPAYAEPGLYDWLLAQTLK